ncbi:MAG: hypothetical protein EXR73_07865 [Myxococcales bacterium]|nr:hypothetical protein [Myxococcales bacterium]
MTSLRRLTALALLLLVSACGAPGGPSPLDATAAGTDSATRSDAGATDGAASGDGARADGSSGGGDAGGSPDAARGGATCSPTCLADSFCEAARGACSGVGACVARPDGCPDNYAPVCGCDGLTYGNDCERQTAGVSLLALGACGDVCSSPAPMGCCMDDLDCAGEERCVLELCGITAGLCKRAPPPPSCWTDEDCVAGRRCEDANICPCGALCLVADMPGTCG